MNDKIKELADQAKKYALDAMIKITDKEQALKVYSETYDTKLAELIVRECAEQIIAKGTDWVDFAPSQTGVRPEYWDMAQQIKKHFGIEE